MQFGLGSIHLSDIDRNKFLGEIELIEEHPLILVVRFKRLLLPFGLTTFTPWRFRILRRWQILHHYAFGAWC
jgi:hypothetical protein